MTKTIGRRGTCAPRDGINGPLMSDRLAGILNVRSVSIIASQAWMLFHRGRIESSRQPVVPINEPGTLVRMAMATEHQIDVVVLQDGHNVLAHVPHPPLAVRNVI